MDSFSRILDEIRSRVASNQGKITTIGIDGPTAAGKTTLADHIKEKLTSEGIVTYVFRFDWTLKDRESRLQDLSHLKQEDVGFDFEAELHMNLDVAKNFLHQIVLFNNKEGADLDAEELVLKGLYNRSDDGKMTGQEKVKLKSGMLVIFEGHYTLRNEFDKYLDLNILLLSKWNELLHRKVTRVKDYRDASAAEDYFWRIDVPSFRNHLNRFGLNADFIIENTNYKHPVLVNKTAIYDWITTSSTKILGERSLIDEDSISDFVLSNSLLVPDGLKSSLSKVIEGIRELDRKADTYLRVNIKSIEIDLSDSAKEVVDKLNSANKGKYHFKLTHQDSLHNVYNRRLPLSLSIGIFSANENKAAVSIIADIFQSELVLQVVWAGGYKKLSILRELGEIASVAKSCVKDSTPRFLDMQQSDDFSIIPVWLPTDFTLPPFMKKHSYNLIYIKKESEIVSPSQVLSKIIRAQGAWIQRFALFSELHFFMDMLNNLGVHTVQTGNYLICVKYPDAQLMHDFFGFRQEWETPLAKQELFMEAERSMDSLIVEERNTAKEFVKHHCPLFSMMDGYLFSEFMYGSDATIKEGISQLRHMFISENRIIRKRATEFVSKCFPLLSLPTAQLWSNLPEDARKSIYLDEFVKLSPSIMAELYLWLSIRKERSSILGCNVYDIRESSIDGSAYLEAAHNHEVPIVLQASLNALGELKTDEAGKVISEGYLKLQNGPVDFVNASMNSARDLFLTRSILPPLFGIGLDHVTSKYDQPKGRAKKFFQKAAETGFLTHYVPDAEGLYDAHAKHSNPYMPMAEFSADLTFDLKKTYLIDREVCAGELNYVNKIAKVQSVEDMRQFMEAYQDALKKRGHLALLSRPTLFIGNLGTMHHGQDKSTPPVETSMLWREALKNENFVSCVLHGTTNTHKGVLHKAAHGCHKINLAGEFLNIMVDNLPEHISRVIYDSDVEPKKMLAAVRPLMNKTPAVEFEQAYKALLNACDNFIETVNSPKMTKLDASYFQHIPYVFSEKQVQVILSEVKNAIEQFRAVPELANTIESRPHSFAASMIEVPEEEMFEYLEALWNSGIRYFHIDAGDGKFITRQFSGVRKARQVRQQYPDAKLHAHLMVENPHFPKGGEVCAIEQYAHAGCDAIAVHPRAFKDRQELMNALSLIRNLGAKPGIVIEISDTFDNKLEEILKEANLDWVVVMGVPIGYGGQLFQMPALQTISKLQAFFEKQGDEYLIEADGGLTLHTLSLCRNAGADVFAGWSIVKATDPKVLAQKIQQVNKVLSGDYKWLTTAT